jgi:rhomboid protease GluP
MSEENKFPRDSERESTTPPPRSSDTLGQQPVSPPRQVVRLQIPPENTTVTYSLIGLTVLVFLGQLLGDYLLQADLLAYYGMKINLFIEDGQLWRLFTAAFLHGGLMHIAFNMYALSILGRELERFYGSVRFLGLYLVCAFAGNVFSYLFTSANSLGASTAVFGLLGAYGIFVLRNRAVFGRNTQRVLRNIGQVLLINLIIGLSPGIDNWGHLGGLLGGAALAWFGGVEYKLIGDPLSGFRLEETSTLRRFALVSAAVLIGFGALVVINAVFLF